MTADKKVKAMRVAMDSLVPAISAKKETIVRCYELRSFQLFEYLACRVGCSWKPSVCCYEPHMVQLLESLPASVAGSWKPSVCCYEPRLVDLFLTKKTSDLQKCLKTKLHYVLGKAITIDMEVLVQNTTYAENFF